MFVLTPVPSVCRADGFRCGSDWTKAVFRCVCESPCLCLSMPHLTVGLCLHVCVVTSDHLLLALLWPLQPGQKLCPGRFLGRSPLHLGCRHWEAGGQSAGTPLVSMASTWPPQPQGQCRPPPSPQVLLSQFQVLTCLGPWTPQPLSPHLHLPEPFLVHMVLTHVCLSPSSQLCEPIL